MLPEKGAIYVINKPINARFGIPRLIALLSSNDFEVNWDGAEPISIVLFNATRTLCKVFSVDRSGMTCSTRRLRAGRFKHVFNTTLIPTRIRRSELIELFNDGRIARVEKLRRV